MKTNVVKLKMFEPRSKLSVREQCDLVRYEDSLGDFIRAGWRHAGEPQKFDSNWHIDCLTDHLMAVARREIQGPGPLIFTLPPRHMKSRGVNVFFPAWTWAQNPDPEKNHHRLSVRPSTLMGPGVKFAFVSYIQRLSDDHGESCLRLIHSDWYRHRWGDRVQLNQAQKNYFDNFAGGSRRALSFSSITGFGADIVVVDDAHDIKNVESNKVREQTLRVWDEVLQTRLNDPKTGILIAIMQRSHERDLVGHILAKEFNGMHVCLPAEFERNHPHAFVNPKWPVRRATVTGEGGPAAGEIWEDKRQKSPSAFFLDVCSYQGLPRRALNRSHDTTPGQVEQKIKSTAILDGERTRIYYPQAPGAAGKFEAYRMVTELKGYIVSTEREVGDKAFRADPFAGQCEHGFVKLLEGPWNDAFIDELCAFPNGGHDDQVDAVCGAFRTLLRRPQYGAIAV